MTIQQRELSGAERWGIVWRNALWPIIVALGVWIVYAIDAVYHVNLLELIKRRDPMPLNERLEVMFSVAVVFSAGSAATALYLIRRGLALARRGVEVVATVTGTGTFSVYNMVKVTYEYEFDGQLYSSALSTIPEEAEKFANGTRSLVLIVDAGNPRVAVQKPRVAGESE